MCVGLINTATVMRRDTKSPDFEALVPENVCRAHLHRLVSSATFSRAEQLRRLLGWLGERSLAPDGIPPTEKEIGETVLRRKDFDPQTDSLVRKEMRRLREKVQRYYAKEGARDRVRLLSAGSYRFRFVWSDEGRLPVSSDSGLPCVLVLPIRALPDLSRQAAHLFEEILVRLAEQGSAQVIAPTTARSYTDRDGDVREFASNCGADVVVEGTMALDTQLRLTLWFVDGTTGRTERPGRCAASEVEELARFAASWLDEQVHRYR